MYIENDTDLDYLDENELWAVAADRRNLPEIRHSAIQQWMFWDDDGGIDGTGERFELLAQRASSIEDTEIEEDDVEEFDHEGPYFDGAGRLLFGHNGQVYLIDESGDDDYFSDEDDDELSEDELYD